MVLAIIGLFIGAGFVPVISGNNNFNGPPEIEWVISGNNNFNGPPEIEWDKTYGGTPSNGARCVQQTNDGGYILAGSTLSYGAGNGDFWLVKTDSSSNKLCKKRR